MHELFALFPALKDINYQLPNILDKCQTLTTHYLEKHLELLNLARKYKYYFDLMMHLIKNFGKEVKILDGINVSPDLLTDITDFQNTQDKIMKEYEDIVQFYESKGISFENAYNELESHVNELFKTVLVNQQQFRTFKDAEEYAKQINEFYEVDQQSKIKEDFPHLSGFMEENKQHYVVFISPMPLQPPNQKIFEYRARKIKISPSQFATILSKTVDNRTLNRDIPYIPPSDDYY